MGITIVFGWFSLLFYLLLILTASRLMKRGEGGIIHLYLVFIFAFWLPMPYVIYQLLTFDFMLMGTFMGTVAYFMLTITMALQTGHLGYSGRKMKVDEDWEKEDKWMIQGLLTAPYESIAGILENTWKITLAIAFFKLGHPILGGVIAMFSLTIVINIADTLNYSMIHPPQWLKKFQGNFVIHNLVSVFFFSTTLIWVTFID